MSLAHSAGLVTPALEYTARLVVWEMPWYEKIKASSNFTMALPFLEAGLVKRVRGRVRSRYDYTICGSISMVLTWILDQL